jgi:hypothetical protein
MVLANSFSNLGRITSGPGHLSTLSFKRLQSCVVRCGTGMQLSIMLCHCIGQHIAAIGEWHHVVCAKVIGL